MEIELNNTKNIKKAFKIICDSNILGKEFEVIAVYQNGAKTKAYTCLTDRVDGRKDKHYISIFDYWKKGVTLDRTSLCKKFIPVSEFKMIIY